MNYLLVGPEEYLKNKFLEKIKKSAPDAGSLQSDFAIFYAGSSSVAGILDFINTFPFLLKERIALIRDLDKLSPKERTSIIKYLEHPLDSTTLILETSSGSAREFVGEISKYTKVITCQKMKEAELILWIKKEFAARKKNITHFQANLIKEIAGDDPVFLENEIAKIATFAGKCPDVTEGHIEAVLGKPSYKTAFELVDLVLQKGIDKILFSLDRLLVREKPHQILNILAWQFRNIIRVKGLPESISTEKSAGILNMNRRIVSRMREQSRRFSRTDLEKKIEILMEADVSIKTGSMEPRQALENALIGLCR